MHLLDYTLWALAGKSVQLKMDDYRRTLPMSRVKSRGPRYALALVVLCSLFGGPALAQEASSDSAGTMQVEVSVLQEVVRIDESGREIVEHKPVGLVTPGTILAYTLHATNTGDGAVFDARIEDPIPHGTILLPDSVDVDDLTITASIDGGESWKSFPVFVATGKDAAGQPVYQQAPADSYTHLRWFLDGPLPPGATKEVSFKVQVR
ncbi:MAG: DUF11 domain-containing protein [Acidobacteria bacterium]|nr:MAG: DUF11 domain-containing protein [Acidobacteriota bacterium]